MASELAPNKVAPRFEAVDAEVVRKPGGFVVTLRKVLLPLASLRLTVALLAMGILLVFAGTLAQVTLDIEEVKRLYFRTFFAWIDFQVFFPQSFFPAVDFPWLENVPGGFYFPGGFTLGGLMFLNLLAAHGLRFKFQATGARLLSGLAVIVVGLLLTWLVVIAGADKDGLDADKIDWGPLWTYCKAGLAALWVGIFYCLLKLDRARWWERRILAASTIALGLLLGWMFYMGEAASLSGPSMRILWQVMKGQFAALVLLGGCALVFRKRAGIVLLHAGVGLLMVNEIVVYALHSEAQFHLREGQTTNYASDLRTVELAVVDPSDPKTDSVTVVPKDLLLDKKPIKNDLLPFDVTVEKFIQNAELRQAGPFEPNQATTGAGKSFIAEARSAGTGTDVGGGVDNTAAYVKLTNKSDGKPLGSYLVSMDLKPQAIEVDGKKYELALRLKREYRPYTVKLIDVSKTDYLGTSTPKDYTSIVRINDPATNEDREVRIWMNNPLRFGGETLYQTSYFKDMASGEEHSSISVVENTGWMIPYVACMIVATGMLAHFWFALVRFLRNRDEVQSSAEGSSYEKFKAPVSGATTKQAKEALGVQLPEESGSGLPELIVPAIAVVLALVVFGYSMKPPRQADTDMKLTEFAKLPIVDEGRMKPIDTVARNALVALSNRQSFYEEKEEKDAQGEVVKDAHGEPVKIKTRQPAIKWLLDVITDREAAMKHKVFRIENLEVQQMLGLPRRSGFLYSLEEFRGKFDEFDRQSDMAAKVDPKRASTYQKKVLELRRKTSVFLNLMLAFEHGLVNLEDEPDRVIAAVRRQKELTEQQTKMSQTRMPLAAPPSEQDGEWETFSSVWMKDFFTAWAKQHDLGAEFTKRPPNPGVASMTAMFDAYAKKDAAKFNEELAGYQDWLAKTEPKDLNETKVNFESFFNHADPFFYAMWFYVLAFILTAVGWLVWPKAFHRAAFALIAVVLLYHTAALIGRIYISGRPPVTNLYSSAVFIGWACVVVGLVFELFYKRGIGNAVASVAGFSTLLIAFFLSRGGDTFSVLQAVLDTQIWLATHVVCITLGYATTYLAGILGIIYILSMTFSKMSSTEAKDIIRMLYGTVCFAILFSFVGTVLGGLWADDSWGRFWGWDPKENGALIIVLWNAIVLHARWGGMVRDRGLAALAVGGNIVTSWSWFGVNELGIGLHSYGFTDGVLLALGLVILSQIAMIVWACCLPDRNQQTKALAGK